MTVSPSLNIHHRENASASNGPGLRAVIWTQGCSLGCSGCFNPQTHPFEKGQPLNTPAWLMEIQTQHPAIEGITISGGEPFQQISALTQTLGLIRTTTSLSIILFTGYTHSELLRNPTTAAPLSAIDVLISGRFRQDQRIATGLLGSANKQIQFLTKRYSPTDFTNIPEAEAWITADGQVRLSGIQPLTW